MYPLAVATTGRGATLVPRRSSSHAITLTLVGWALMLESGLATLTRTTAKAPDLHSQLFKGATDAAIIREKQIWEQDMKAPDSLTPKEISELVTPDDLEAGRQAAAARSTPEGAGAADADLAAEEDDKPNEPIDVSPLGAAFLAVIDAGDGPGVAQALADQPGIKVTGSVCGRFSCALRGARPMLDGEDPDEADPGALTELLKAGADVFERGEDKQLLFHTAVSYGNIKVLALIDSHGVCPVDRAAAIELVNGGFRDGYHGTEYLIHLPAHREGDIRRGCLGQLNVDPNQMGPQFQADNAWMAPLGETEPLVADDRRVCYGNKLYAAVAKQRMRIVDLMLSFTARCGIEVDLNVTKADRWWTPLHQAANGGDSDFARQLIAGGAAVDVTDVLTQSPLHIAATAGHFDIAAALLRQSPPAMADKLRGMKDIFGRTAADAARMAFPTASAKLHWLLAPPDKPPYIPVPHPLDWPDDSSRGDPDSPAIADPGPAATTLQAGAVLTPEKSGWRTYSGTPPLLGNGRCDIDEVDYANMTCQRFFRDYFLARRPVVLRGAATNWELRKKWTKKMFVEYDAMLGGAGVKVGKIPYGNLYGGSDTLTTIGAHIAAMFKQNPAHGGNGSESAVPLYVFTTLPNGNDRDLIITEALPELATWMCPNAFDDVEYIGTFPGLKRVLPFLTFAPGNLQMAIGSPGSGAPFHMHSHAVNANLHGRKRWFMYNATRPQLSNLPALEFYENVYPALPPADRPLECVQQAGDIMYVPAFFSHAVLNVDDSVAVAQEFQPFFSSLPYGL